MLLSLLLCFSPATSSSTSIPPIFWILASANLSWGVRGTSTSLNSHVCWAGFQTLCITFFLAGIPASQISISASTFALSPSLILLSYFFLSFSGRLESISSGVLVLGGTLPSYSAAASSLALLSLAAFSCLTSSSAIVLLKRSCSLLSLWASP